MPRYKFQMCQFAAFVLILVVFNRIRKNRIQMKFTKQELEAVFTVGIIMALRLLGIFLILPVFSVYAERYPGADIALAGVAFGIYALAQSLLQIPFGWASDKIGRKPILLLGLSIFTVGSILCGLSDNITELILARIVQGSGAVSSVAIASLGDVTRSEVRARAFTIVGLTIGGAFLIAIIAGPILAAKIGFDTLFFVLAAFGVIAMIATLIFFPEIKKESFMEEESQVLDMLKVPEMRKLFISALIISFTVNMFVFIYPLSWTELGISEATLWKKYLIALIPTAVFVYPMIRRAERSGTLRYVTLVSWALMAVSFLIYPAYPAFTWVLYLSGMAYFAGHTVLQSLFPAFLTQRVGQKKRGATTGIYNLAGFFGASMGGMIAGYFYQLNPTLPVLTGLFVLILWGIYGVPQPTGAITVDE